MVNYSIPFYENTDDNTHCFQAAMKMVVEYFEPDRVMSFAEWDKISAKVEGLYTWPMAALMWMSKQGYEILLIESFDYNRFALEGEAYLEALFGKEVADKQAEMSDMDQEQKFARVFPQYVKIENRLPDLHDITSKLDEGYLVGCNVNARVLNGREGYAGHFVVIKGYQDGRLILNDPGLPAYENRILSREDFMNAWKYPNKEALNLMAFRKSR